jgi:allantoinase
LGFWAGLVPGNARNPDTLTALLDAGAMGFKAFMAPSGIDDFPNVSKVRVGGQRGGGVGGGSGGEVGA